MRAESTWYGAINPSTGQEEFRNQIGSDFLGDNMAKVKIRKRDLRRGKWKVVNMDYRYGSKWDTDNDDTYLIYTIFEKAKVRYSASVRVSGASTPQDRRLGFRSSDGEWIADYISSSQAGSYYGVNGCIKVYTGWY